MQSRFRRQVLAGALALSAAAGGLGLSTAALSADSINLYTARHYGKSDQALYDAFTAKTGIKVNLVSAKDEALVERLKSEGKASPADVILMVDAARLWNSEQLGFFQPIESPILKANIPAELQSNNKWFGFSTRARVLVVDPLRVKAGSLRSYEDLARPEFKGMVCSRSSSHPYMISMIGSVIAHLGPQKAEEWAKGVVANMARPPKGGDTDQIKAVASGECGIAITNSYYFVRLMRSAKPEDRAIAAKTKLIWPNQEGVGTHVNISGGGVAANAKNVAGAKAFLEFLASPETQAEFANGNNEWPAMKTAPFRNPELASLGDFKRDTLPVGRYASLQADAAAMLDRVGWR